MPEVIRNLENIFMEELGAKSTALNEIREIPRLVRKAYDCLQRTKDIFEKDSIEMQAARQDSSEIEAMYQAWIVADFSAIFPGQMADWFNN